MANPFRKIDLWIALAALTVLGATIWLLIHAARQVQLELIPPSLTVAPARAGAYVLLCLIVGALTMALVQVWRMLVPVRGFFQRAALLRFFEKGLESENGGKYALKEFELRSSTTVGERSQRRGFWRVLSPNLYDLPIEQLCGQLNLAFEAAMTAPKKFRALVEGVLGHEGAEPLDLSMRDFTDAGNEEEKVRNQWLLRQAEARATVFRMAQQRIDGFQISTGDEWRRLLRVCVVVISVVFSWQATAYHLDRATPRRAMAFEAEPGFSGDSNTAGSDFDGRVLSSNRSDVGSPMTNDLPAEDYASRSWGTHLFQSVLMGLVAGYVAMLLRDLTAILELKRRQT